MKRLAIALVAALNLLLADAVVKEASVARLKGVEPVAVVPGLFSLAYVENRGCAWGMFQGHVWPLAAFGLLALAFLAWRRADMFGAGQPADAAAWAAAAAEPLLYAGIAGNVVDRLFRGFVVDMFDAHWGVRHFPCFNLADSYITIAVALLLLAPLLPSAARGARPRG